jgi:hypothetical protein
MKHRILVLMPFIVLGICGVCAFFSSFSLGLFLPQRFAAAESQWEASNIRNYQVVVGISSFSEWYQYRIVVHNGEIVEAGRRPPLLSYAVEDPPYNPSTFTPIEFNQASPYTLDALMSRASETVGNAPLFEIRPCVGTYWDATYDSQYGYVSSLRFNPGGGFFGCAIGDAWGGYTVLSFTPLP